MKSNIKIRYVKIYVPFCILVILCGKALAHEPDLISNKLSRFSRKPVFIKRLCLYEHLRKDYLTCIG